MASKETSIGVTANDVELKNLDNGYENSTSFDHNLPGRLNTVSTELNPIYAVKQRETQIGVSAGYLVCLASGIGG